MHLSHRKTNCQITYFPLTMNEMHFRWHILVCLNFEREMSNPNKTCSHFASKWQQRMNRAAAICVITSRSVRPDID